MKTRVEQSDLDTAIKTASAASGRGDAVYSVGVLIEAKDGEMSCTCTNLELTIQSRATAATEEPGSAVVAAGRFAKIVNSLRGGAVTLSSDDEVLVITSGSAEFSLRTMDRNAWPNVKIGKKGELTLDRKMIADLNKLLPYAATAKIDPARQGLVGIHLEGNLAMATDTVGGAVLELGGNFPSATIPRDTLTAVLKANPDTLQLEVGDTIASLTSNNTTWTTTLLAAQFPHVERVIPERSDYSLTFDSEELVDAVTRIKAAGDAIDSVHISTEDVPDGFARLSSVDSTAGTEAVDEIECEGDFVGTVRFNPATIIDFVKGADSERTTFEINGPLQAFCGHSEGFSQAIMPRRGI